MEILSKIVKWAEKEENVKSLILTGSRARKNAADEWSDYDIAVFCQATKQYTDSENWLKDIGNVWICVKEKISLFENTFQTRLVIFEGGIKVDFSLLPLEILDQKIAEPLEYNRGYRVLLDKNNYTKILTKPDFKEPKAIKPTHEEFLRVINEFWFEAYNVAIHLKRNDLWHVKFRSNIMHEFLLRMIEWHAEAEHNWEVKCPPNGKRLSTWVDKETRQSLQGVFAHFDANDSWKALFSTIKIFRELAQKVGRSFLFTYPESIDHNMSKLIEKLE